MRVLFDMGHPAHVHLFKNIIKKLTADGHEVKITARDKEVTLALLKSFGLEYENRGAIYHGMINKAFGMLRIDYALYRIAKKFRPDLLIGVHNPYIAHVGFLLRKPAIIFTDTENVKIASLITYPFVKCILTPAFFLEHVDPKKHIAIKGFKETAYLHPDYFTPDPHVLSELGLSADDKFIILRFISWGASHDVGLSGIHKGAEKDIISALSPYGKIFITSEKPLEGELEQYRLQVPPEKIHSLLYYARLYIGEGGTMAVESAMLGTPAIHIESAADGQPTGASCGNFLALRDKYHLLHFYATQDEALKKAIEILKNENSKKEWQKKQQMLMADVVDVTAWFTEFIEDYPESLRQKIKQTRSSK
jgi:uncharacterized protein